MQTWHCTTRGGHLPHVWVYRKENNRNYRCDGQDLRVLRTEEQPMYVRPNFKTKKALRVALQAGRKDITVFAPGLGTPKRNGIETVEGPHYPEPHRWYARVEVVDGIVTRVVG